MSGREAERELSAESVLAFVASFTAGMQTLDSPSGAVLEHVKLRNADGPDVRVDRCPCARGLETLPKDEAGQPIVPELGGGQYVASGRHTYADVIRDVVSDGDNV